MKLKYHFSYIQVGDEITGVPVGTGSKNFHGILIMNETGKTIMTLLEEDREPEEIQAYFVQRCPDSDPKRIRDCVVDFVEQLMEKELVV